jgi:lipopolysaccharide transport system ATP-binding protein
VADLPGSAQARVVEGLSSLPPARNATGNTLDKSAPTVFHVTHWKAGSQWIYKILTQLCPESIVKPELDQLRRYPVQRGRVYPTVYMSKQGLDQVMPPEGSRRFVVIRDLRDTLVSAYFSFKSVHPVIPGFSISLRKSLQELDLETGLIHLMDYFLQECARIQLSWLEAPEDLVLKYEDLLTNDLSLLEFALIDHCHLPVTREAVREAVLAARFETLTGGRARGCGDLSAHERKGVAGDWRNHFTDKVKRAFKARYGGLLVAAGYEKDLSW